MNMPFQTFDEQGDASNCAPRLAALRAELASRGVHGFLIPRADEHQGEYVPKRAERLAWLTGFTGSAGLSIVLMEKGRRLRRRPLHTSGPEPDRHDVVRTLDLMNDGPTNWIEANLPKGARLGYDPWLHTQGTIERLRMSVERVGGSLAPLAPNPLDQVWPDQPSRRTRAR
jgi:Xaa-Pro aminopeptidase